MNSLRTSEKHRRAFSLLEVIIATAMLSASAVMLLGLLSTGERHGRQAERRVMAQMLCQSKLDEYLAFPSTRRAVNNEPIPRYADWEYSLKETPTEMEGLVRVQVSVRKTDPAQTRAQLDPDAAPKAFELVRLVRRPVPRTTSPGRPTAEGNAASLAPTVAAP